MFLTAAYFQGELYLPNLKVSGDAVGVAKALLVTGENTLEWFIAKYETQCLNDILGEKLAKNFIDGMNMYPVPDIWEDLKDHLFIEKDGYYYSPVANYVYYWLTRDGRTQTTTKGEQRATQDYSSVVSDENKLVKSWNDMWPMIHSLRKYLRDNWSLYKEYADGECWSLMLAPTNAFGI